MKRTSIAAGLAALVFIPITGFAFTNDQAASYELGASDFVTPGHTTAQGAANILTTPWKPAYDAVHHFLFVPDTIASRILVFDLSNGITNAMSASYVLGQPDFTSLLPNTTQTGLNVVDNVVYDPASQWLFAADASNNRILIYDLSHGISNGMAASYVLGQTDFNSKVAVTFPSLTQHNLCAPDAMAYDPSTKRLYVVDNAPPPVTYHRVLVFDLSGGVTNGMDASYVLGQPDFTTHTRWPVGQGSLDGARDVEIDSIHQRLFVADMNRVLIWDLSQGITNGMNASFVLGQPDFVSSSGLTTQTGMILPFGLSYDSTANKLYVAEASNNRVLIFDFTSGITNGMPATNVLGQPDFVTNTPLSPPNSSGLSFPTGEVYDSTSGELFVSDKANSRVLVFVEPVSVATTTTYYSCSSGSCAQDPNGPYTVADCNSQCMAPPPTHYSCTGAGNACTQDSNGPYTTADCNSQCAAPPPTHYSCTGAGNACTQDSNGPYTTADCNSQCAAPSVGCGSLAVCGSVTTAENPHTLLSGALVELRDNQGKRIAITKTDQTGAYRFDANDGISMTQSYYAMPVVGRTESALPLRTAVNNVPSQGSQANFQIQGALSTLQVQNSPPGSLIVLSTFNYVGQGTDNPPSLNSSEGPYFVSTTAGWDGTSTVQAGMGTYYVTCWHAEATPGSTSVTFIRSPIVGSNGPYSATPNQSIQISCL